MRIFRFLNEYEEFAIMPFLKVGASPDYMEKRFGGAGAGFQYHHIVTQGGVNTDIIPPEQLQNTDNIIILPTLLHEEVNDEYLKPGPGGSNEAISMAANPAV